MIGQVHEVFGNIPAPTNWLQLGVPGVSYPISQYTALYNSLLSQGLTIVDPNDSTRFLLPDVAGRTLVCAGSGGSSNIAIADGVVTGQNSAQLGQANIPLYTPNVTGLEVEIKASIDNPNGINETDGGANGFRSAGSQADVFGEVDDPSQYQFENVGNVSVSGSITGFGSANPTPVNVVQPSIGVRMFIEA